MQMSLLFDAVQTPRAYTVADARKAGDVAGNRAADRTERADGGFRESAQAFVLGYLAQHGVSSGELITDAAKLAGIRPPDDRAFGPVYGTLSRSGKIVAAGFCARVKGHGTAGGRLWRLA
jgi:hypothetical protein